MSEKEAFLKKFAELEMKLESDETYREELNKLVEEFFDNGGELTL